jgi:MbtH protein
VENKTEQPEYKILVNDEGQYSIWPGFKDAPLGWREVGPAGAKSLCLEWIGQNWTDMRPRSIRDDRK